MQPLNNWLRTFTVKKDLYTFEGFFSNVWFEGSNKLIKIVIMRTDQIKYNFILNLSFKMSMFLPNQFHSYDVHVSFLNRRRYISCLVNKISVIVSAVLERVQRNYRFLQYTTFSSRIEDVMPMLNWKYIELDAYETFDIPVCHSF